MVLANLCPSCAMPLPPATQYCPGCRGHAAHYAWVQLECSFQCRGCGHRAPLNHLDLDGSVLCLHCGLEQVFSKDSWKEALEFAHSVADLAGTPDGRAPHPLLSIGAQNPYVDVGTAQRPSVTLDQSGSVVEDGLQIQKSLRTVATPLHPRDQETGEPLQFHLLPGGEIIASSPSSGKARKYRAQLPAWPSLASVAAVLSEEYRSDQAVARSITNSAGVAVLQCPSCGGTLRVEANRRTTDCGFCHTVCRIPHKVRFAASHRDASVLPWWVLFTAPSPLRKRLESGAVAGLDRAKQREKGKGRAEESKRFAVYGAERVEGASPIEKAVVWLLTLATIGVGVAFGLAASALGLGELELGSLERSFGARGFSPVGVSCQGRLDPTLRSSAAQSPEGAGQVHLGDHAAV